MEQASIRPPHSRFQRRPDRARRGAAAAQPRATRPWLALAVLCLPLLIVSLDNTVLNVVLPTLERKLHASTSELQWIVDSYVLVFAGLLLAAGSLADRVGRKLTFVVGLVMFAAGSSWASASGSVEMLIAARASMGIGAALIMPSTLAIITNTFADGGERQRALGIWASTTGAGIALGPIVGGLLLAHFWWGSVFLINVPIALLGLGLAVPLVPNSRNDQALAPDLAGALMSIMAMGLIVWAIIEAPVRGWSATLVIGAGAAGLAVLAAFALWEWRSSHPMLQLAFFRRRSFSAAVSSVGLVMFGLFGTLFVLTQFLQLQLGYTALQAGVRTLPAAAAIAVVAPLSTISVRLLGIKATVVAGMVLIAAGLFDISGATVATTYSGVLPGMILLGVGAGMTIPAATGSVMGSVPSAHTGVGSATNGTLLQLGGAFGVAVVGSLMSTRYEHRLASALALHHVPAAVTHAASGSLAAAIAVGGRIGGPSGQFVVHTARSAFVSGMDSGLLVAAFVAIAGAILALLVLPSRLPGPAPTVTPAP
ncbi:MAG: MFS transporter [Solirubrobacteraceae bacterium]